MTTENGTENQTQAQGHYTPQGKPDVLPIRGKKPTASLRVNKRTVIVLSAVVCLVVMFSLLQAFAFKPRPGAEREQEQPQTRGDLRTPAPTDVISKLPQDYTDIRTDTPRLGEPLNGELGATVLAHKREKEARAVTGRPQAQGYAGYGQPTQPMQLTAEQRATEEQQSLSLKRAAEARSSDVSFGGQQSGLSPLQNGGPDMSKLLAGVQPGAGTSGALPVTQRNTARDDDNRQDDKGEFLNTKRKDSPYLKSSLIRPASPYQVMAGTIIPGVLLTGINSDLPGQIVGQVSQNVFDTVNGNHLLIPQGTRVIGEYDSRVAYGQERVLIVWTRLIMPDGSSISLEGMPGVDLSGYAGLTDRVNNHYLRLLGGVVMGSLLGAAAQMAEGSTQSVNPSFGQLALQGAAQNTNQAGQQLTRKNLNIQPTLEIRPGYRFNVFVTKDVILQPYKHQ